MIEEKLIRARGYVERGWTKSRYHHRVRVGLWHREDRYCAMGALNMAFGGLPFCMALFNSDVMDREEALGLLRTSMRELGLRGGWSIMDMNDSADTTKELVLRAFDLAIKEARLIEKARSWDELCAVERSRDQVPELALV